MIVTVDAWEVMRFARNAGLAADVLEREMARTTNALAAEGLGFAKEYAPVDGGNLSNAIHLQETASPGSLTASWGVNEVEYAYMREFGGTIVPRNGKYLVFEIGGQLIFAKSVTQTGTRYMNRSADSVEPLMQGAYDKAVERALAAFGGP